jgi:hypothetical protein
VTQVWSRAGSDDSELDVHARVDRIDSPRSSGRSNSRISVSIATETRGIDVSTKVRTS